MTASPHVALKWSSQFTILPISRTPLLKGDKIILPPSALEQLLSAATTTVQRRPAPSDTDFDPSNPYSVAAARGASAHTLETQQTLPHPLTFRLVNPENGNIVFAGIREFSAEEGSIGVSHFLRGSLGLKDDGSEAGDGHDEGNVGEISSARLTVHVQELGKGTYVKLRPLEPGYDPEDWKALLERSLRDNFTTLTKGEILSVAAGKEDFRFLVDEIRPNNEAISLVDTDLEVDIEALNEEQARETLKRQAQKLQKAPGTSTGSSAGGKLNIRQFVSGQVLSGEYVDYTIDEWDRSQDLEVSLDADDPDFDLDLFTSPSGPKQRARPREDEYGFGDLSMRSTKRIKIEHTNAALENAEALWVSVRGRSADPVEDSASPMSFSLTVASIAVDTRSMPTSMDVNSDAPSSPDDIRCKNCRQWVPKRTMVLHENFCLRNNVVCPHCSNVFKKSSEAWKNHWHCPHDSEYGSTSSQHLHHDAHFHTAQSCKDCAYDAFSMRDLAHHRTTTCPGKLILCQFCHLIVPQQGPDDPDPSDPEVVISGLTPHELSDGARTTECHLCAKIVRLRDMSTHLRHHDLQRLSRTKPKVCRNANCGRTLDQVSKTGDVKYQSSNNDLGVCDTCFGPLYVSMYDPDGKALRRRVERKYLTQLLTGCGQSWCENEYCKSAKANKGEEVKITSKEAMTMIKPLLDGLKTSSGLPVHFCTDQTNQLRRNWAGTISTLTLSADGTWQGSEAKGQHYDFEWCIAALGVVKDVSRVKQWLREYAPTREESSR